MLFDYHAAWLTNSKGNTYEDRLFLPLGDLPARLEAAQSDDAERIIQGRIAALTSRGLLFAVLDGVGGAPLGMRAAQRTVDSLRELYRRADFAPREGVPTARDVLALLYEANQHVSSWGTIDDDESSPVGAGATGRPKGAACVTAAYVSPAGNVTLFQAGDTAAFVYRQRGGVLELFTGASDVAGRSVRKYIGLGASLHIDTFPLAGLQQGDLVALVTDGVYPKGFSARDAVRAVLDEADCDPCAAAQWLVERSRARGSTDDITALVLIVSG